MVLVLDPAAQVTVLEMPDNTNAAPDFTSKDRFEVGENETAVGTVIATDAYTQPGPSAGKAALVARAAEEDAVPLTCIVEGPTAMPDKPATIILEVKGIDESE